MGRKIRERKRAREMEHGIRNTANAGKVTRATRERNMEKETKETRERHPGKGNRGKIAGEKRYVT